MKRFVTICLVLIAGGVLMLIFWPREQQHINGQERKRGEFASDRVPPLVEFDGKRAMGYLAQICTIGARMSGTDGMKAQQELIIKHFDGLGYPVQKQTFKAKQHSQAQAIEMTNLIVRFFPERQRRVILCCHYDTRPMADQETDPRKWREPFLSANDGGSGVAFMMEFAHHMKEIKTSVGVDFVMFDGEEYVFDRKKDKYFFGSEHFAQTWKKSIERPVYLSAILLDMIAGRTAVFPVEGYSFQRCKPLATAVWKIAADLEIRRFLWDVGERVQDDHLALQNVGIPAIDIIDFNYPHWHRLSDTPENCAPEPMEDVAKVISVWLQWAK